MKINRDLIVRAALRLLNESGLEQLTLRSLAAELKVQAPTIYWHFESKEALLDQMATLVLGEGAKLLHPRRNKSDWQVVAVAFGSGLRKILLGCRDGARMVSGTRLTDTIYLEATEQIAAKLLRAGFTLRQSVVLLSTLYNYTLSFVMEEQAVFTTPGTRSPRYNIEERNARLDPAKFPLHRQSGAILFDRFDRRFKEGMNLILQGASLQINSMEAE